MSGLLIDRRVHHRLGPAAAAAWLASECGDLVIHVISPTGERRRIRRSARQWDGEIDVLWFRKIVGELISIESESDLPLYLGLPTGHVRIELRWGSAETSELAGPIVTVASGGSVVLSSLTRRQICRSLRLHRWPFSRKLTGRVSVVEVKDLHFAVVTARPPKSRAFADRASINHGTCHRHDVEEEAHRIAEVLLSTELLHDLRASPRQVSGSRFGLSERSLTRREPSSQE